VNDRARSLLVPLAALTAVALVVAWFPLHTLLTQSAQLNGASRQLATLAAESRALAAERKALSSPEAVTELARQEYQLVAPGQRIIQILSGPSGGSMSTGDPGSQPLASPTQSKGLVPVSTSLPANSAPTGFWGRVVRTFEFWR
jgi:cell division protein FtsB